MDVVVAGREGRGSVGKVDFRGLRVRVGDVEGEEEEGVERSVEAGRVVLRVGRAGCGGEGSLGRMKAGWAG